MFSRTRLQLFFASALLVLSALAYGGGYWLEFAEPSASKDPAAKGAIVLVRALGCGEPTKSTVTAKAEGFVAGERKAIELQVVPLAKPGVYAIKGNLPQEGKWVISVAGSYLGARTGTVAALTSNGFDRKSVKAMRHEPARDDIDAVLIAAR
jgi:hypothetical protein